MDTQKLHEIAEKLVAPGKGILAADESMSTMGKRLEALGIENSEENRRAYRSMILTAPEIGNYISGVILFDETLRQNADDGRTMVSVLESEGVMPGIKVDGGLYDMPDSPLEKLTKGFEGLPERLAEYARLGAKFTKWRAVITIGNSSSSLGAGGLPTDVNLRQNAKDLAAYAKAAQDAGLVPMVEPEVLMDGAHTIEACKDASARILTALFEELKNAGVALDGMILKTNMVVPGKKSGSTATPAEVADATLAVFSAVLPSELAGQAFLSGGQSEVEATQNLNEMNKRGPHPWNLSFSFGRALLDSALKTWAGKAENKPAAQAALIKRAKMNSLATLGTYQGE